MKTPKRKQTDRRQTPWPELNTEARGAVAYRLLRLASELEPIDLGWRPKRTLHGRTKAEWNRHLDSIVEAVHDWDNDSQIRELASEIGIANAVIRRDLQELRRIQHAFEVAEIRTLEAWLARAAGGRPVKGGTR